MTLALLNDADIVPTAWFNEVRDRIQEGNVGITTAALVATTGTFSGNVTVAGTLGVTGALSTGNLAVTGTITATGNITSDANLRSKSGTAFTGTIDHAITADRTWTIPDLTGTVALLEGTQTFTGAKTFSAALVASDDLTVGGTALFVDQSTGKVAIGTATPGEMGRNFTIRGTDGQLGITINKTDTPSSWNLIATSDGFRIDDSTNGNVNVQAHLGTNPRITIGSTSLPLRSGGSILHVSGQNETEDSATLELSGDLVASSTLGRVDGVRHEPAGTQTLYGNVELAGSGTEGQVRLSTLQGGVVRIGVEVKGRQNVLLGTVGGIATTANDGFPFIPAAAGVPTGTPSEALSSNAALYYDSTNDNLYAYDGVGAAWVNVTGVDTDTTESQYEKLSSTALANRFMEGPVMFHDVLDAGASSAPAALGVATDHVLLTTADRTAVARIAQPKLNTSFTDTNTRPADGVIVKLTGFMTITDFANLTDECGLLISSSVGIGNWDNANVINKVGFKVRSAGTVHLVTANGSSVTESASVATVSSGTAFKYELIYRPGTNATLSINDSALTTNTTNLPAETGNILWGQGSASGTVTMELHEAWWRMEAI